MPKIETSGGDAAEDCSVNWEEDPVIKAERRRDRVEPGYYDISTDLKKVLLKAGCLYNLITGLVYFVPKVFLVQFKLELH